MSQKMGISIKKVISVLLLISLLGCYSFSESLFQWEPAQTKLTALEDSLTSLENNLIEKQKQIDNLELNLNLLNQDLNNANLLSMSLESQLEETSLQCENALNSLKKSDMKLRVYRIMLVAVPVMTFTTGLILGLKVRE